jgi:hypothetical protein
MSVVNMKKIKLHPKVEEILEELKKLKHLSRFKGMSTKDILDYCRTH